jgi:predicted amino acid racemase
VVSLGNDSALIIGGKQKDKLILESEIIDTKTKKSYFPKSGFKLQDDVQEILGIFKLSQEIVSATIKSRDPIEYVFQKSLMSNQDQI